MSSQTWWYVARSGGIVAWAMLAVSVFWGLALSSRFLGKQPKPNWMLDLHRFLGGAAVIFTGVHIVGLVGDSFVYFGAVEILVPFSGDYHPVAVAWGIITMYLLVAVEVTSLVRKRLSKRVWRAIHYLSFPLLVGTDRRTTLLRFGSLLVVGVLTVVTMIRVVRSDRQPPARAPARA
jgi:predicted ferric reductase